MHVENWPNLKELLLQALELEPAARPHFIETIPAAQVRHELTSLLSFDGDSQDFMSAPAASLAGGLFSVDEVSDKIPAEIGPFRIVRELGIGGMGAVYLAERVDGKFSQQVAIKLVKREFNAARVRAAFAREIDILAKLVHPNIARLLDTGVTDDGIPYLVMEYVDGRPIDRFCTERALPLAGTLKLFNKVCEAVAFSHQNLIVHRDIKPSNIIVQSDGTPKLLDFGISKLLVEGERDTALTLLGAMTPEYASPEQIGRGNVTTATDVYSLGVILYKLLTGKVPFTGDNMLSDIVHSDPPAPSKTVGPVSRYSAAHLRGDLDNIVLKAMNKDSQQRYLTIEQLREDIWRYIDGHPVHARRPTLSYRLVKSIRRYKVAAAAALLIVASIFAGTSVALWQATEARGQAVIAASETEKAKAEEKRSEKISKFMFKVLSYADPSWYAEGAKEKGQARVIDVMLELSDDIDKQFAGEADIAAELHHRFCDILNSFGSPDPKQLAQFHAQRAYDLRRQYYGEQHELVAKDMLYLVFTGQVPREERAPFMVKTMQMMRETNPLNLNYPYMIEDYVSRLILPKYAEQHEAHYAALNTTENRYKIAEQMLREADVTFRHHYAEDYPAVIANGCRLAYALTMQGRPDEAAPYEKTCRDAFAAQKIGKANVEYLDLARATQPSSP